MVETLQRFGIINWGDAVQFLTYDLSVLSVQHKTVEKIYQGRGDCIAAACKHVASDQGWHKSTCLPATISATESPSSQDWFCSWLSVLRNPPIKCEAILSMKSVLVIDVSKSSHRVCLFSTASLTALASVNLEAVIMSWERYLRGRVLAFGANTKQSYCSSLARWEWMVYSKLAGLTTVLSWRDPRG